MADSQANKPDTLDQFLSMFGEPGVVFDELCRFWRSSDASIDPVVIYNHLIDARIKLEKITPEQGAQLKNYFKQSFSPDTTTGFYPKHREPLVEAFANAYSARWPQAPIYRVEADIKNLGGLNKALGDTALADVVIRFMANRLKEKLSEGAKVIAVRHGGDELSFYVLKPKNGQNKSSHTVVGELEASIKAAQAEVFKLIKATNLSKIKHTKENKPSGIGFGAAVVAIKPTDKKQALILDVGTDASKKDFDQLLKNEADSSSTAELSKDALVEKLRSVFAQDEYQRYSTPPEQFSDFINKDTDFSGETPEDARLAQLMRLVKPKRESTRKLVIGTHKLTAKTDFVTGLPMFGAIGEAQVPHFKMKYKTEKAKLLHIDFNNLGGGNNLGPWVGDAMSRVFTECVEEAMKGAGLSDYSHYLTSQGGGKFALLVPESVKPEVIQSFERRVRMQLNRRSSEPLRLEEWQIEPTRQKLIKAANEEFARSNSDPERPMRRVVLDPKIITINDINNTKARRDAGSWVVCSVSDVNLNQDPAVRHTIESLVERAKHEQGVWTDYREAIGAKKRKIQSDVPDTRVSQVIRAKENIKAMHQNRPR